MQPPKGFCATFWSLLYFLPFFLGLLLLGIIKGALLCPFVCLIMTLGNASIIVSLWPAHLVWTYYSIARAKQLGPVLKLTIAIGVPIIFVLWPIAGIFGNIIVGAGYGFLAPLMATFDAVGEGKSNDLVHCFLDGTWSTIDRSFKVIVDFKNVCYHSYFSVMNELRLHDPTNGEPYEIRMQYTPGACIIGLLGILVDVPMITLIAIWKSPYMLFKGWKRLFDDLIGREGPFLETACVPFAGLVILLWPLAVAGAVMASTISSFFLGAYAAIIAYQEKSVKMGLAYIISSLSIFDEYSNDILDMREGSCFPRHQYRKTPVRSSSFNRSASFHPENQDGKKPPSRATSFKDSILELNPLMLLDYLFLECKRHGETLLSEGVITSEDINASRSSKGCGSIISIGLPAYCILQALLRSIKVNSNGLVLSDKTEITSQNRPEDKFFDWFFDPLMVLKDQIKAENFSEEEEKYFSKLVLLHGDPVRLQNLNAQARALDKLKQAKIDAFARRLQGITKSISRYPTWRRRFHELVKSLSDDLDKKFGSPRPVNGSQAARIKSGIARFFSRKPSEKDTRNQGNPQEVQEINIAVI
ncbi:hypothetical protein Cni_G10048 [Canna indica]|uniref:Uncharacterized protein n=1 Tax=Canna indica TaxID=4628 RepID=A0AAQ3K3Q7_9LILI|nr:hypothetical protein Cni_G10048 [Canna indica]